MPLAPETAFTAGDATHRLTADTVRVAATRLTPADSADSHPNRSWYALGGTYLYYVVDLVETATGVGKGKVKTARQRLTEIGLPVFALAWSTLLTKEHLG